MIIQIPDRFQDQLELIAQRENVTVEDAVSVLLHHAIYGWINSHGTVPVFESYTLERKIRSLDLHKCFIGDLFIDPCPPGIVVAGTARQSSDTRDICAEHPGEIVAITEAVEK